MSPFSTESKMAPRAGFEPATLRLTAGCSAVELPRNEVGRPERGRDVSAGPAAPDGTAHSSGFPQRGATVSFEV